MAKRPQFSAVSDLIGSDEQSSAMDAHLQEIDTSQEFLIREVLVDLSPEKQREHIRAVASARASIIDHWQKASHQFLLIGRTLNKLAEELPEASLRRMIESYDRVRGSGEGREPVLPFGKTTANRLMLVARAVDNGTFAGAFQAAGRSFSEDLLPPYTIAARLSTIEPPLLIEAVKQDLVRPDVSRRVVEEFCDNVRRPKRQSDTVALVRDIQKTDKALSHHFREIVRLSGVKDSLLAALKQAGIPTSAPTDDPTSLAVAALRQTLADTQGGSSPDDPEERGGEGDKEAA